MRNLFHVLCSSDEDDENYSRVTRIRSRTQSRQSSSEPPEQTEPQPSHSEHHDRAATCIQKIVRGFLHTRRFRAKMLQVELENTARLQIDVATAPEKRTAEEKDPLDESEAISYAPGHMFVDMGDEPPVFAASKAYLFNSQKFSQIQFFGRCFLCAYAGHSQRYCALKYCVSCDTFGHSAVCCGKQNFQIQNHRRQSLKRFKRAAASYRKASSVSSSN